MVINSHLFAGILHFSEMMQTELPYCFEFTCYTVITGTMNWDEAQEKCQGIGLHAVTLYSTQQMLFMTQFIQQDYGRSGLFKVIVKTRV